MGGVSMADVGSTDGWRFRVLTVVDDCTREYLNLTIDTSISGARAARELATLIGARRKPVIAVSHNGTPFTSNAIPTFADDRKIDWRYIATRKPTQNAFISRLQRAPAARNLERNLCSRPCTTPVPHWPRSARTILPRAQSCLGLAEDLRRLRRVLSPAMGLKLRNQISPEVTRVAQPAQNCGTLTRSPAHTG